MAADAEDVVALKDSDYGVWSEGPSSAWERWPGLDNAAIYERARSAYVIATNVTCTWFDDGGNRLLQRAADNDRNQESTRQEYVQLILEDGIAHGGRAEAVGIPAGMVTLSGTNAMHDKSGNVMIDCEVKFLCAATLVESFYMAQSNAPLNPQVKTTTRQGLRGVTLLDPRTPSDIRTYFKEKGDQYNCIGSRSSFLELYALVPTIDQARKDEANKKRKATRELKKTDVLAENEAMHEAGQDSANDAAKAKKSQAGLETSYFDYIKKNWPKKFHSWSMWSAAKVFYHKMLQYKLWSPYLTYCNQNCKFTDATLTNCTLIGLNNDILKLFEDSGKDLLPLLPLVLRFCIPTGDQTPWLIKNSGDLKKVKLLFTEMASSKLYKEYMAKHGALLDSVLFSSQSPPANGSCPSAEKKKTRGKKPPSPEVLSGSTASRSHRPSLSFVDRPKY